MEWSTQLGGVQGAEWKGAETNSIQEFHWDMAKRSLLFLLLCSRGNLDLHF